MSELLVEMILDKFGEPDLVADDKLVWSELEASLSLGSFGHIGIIGEGLCLSIHQPADPFRAASAVDTWAGIARRFEVPFHFYNLHTGIH